METNTPEKSPEFQEKYEAIATRLQANLKKAVDDTFPSNDEQEEPPPSEESPKTSLTLSEGLGFERIDVLKILANLVRDKEFYETFGPWMKPAYFSTADPYAPNEAMSEIFEIDKNFKKDGILLDRELLKVEIRKYFIRFKKNEKELPDWYELVDEIFGFDPKDLHTDYYAKQMAKVFMFQEAKLAFHKFIEDFKFQKTFQPEIPLKVLHDQTGKLLELGTKDQTNIGIDSEEFLKIEFPPKKIIIHPWLKERSVGMIAGQMGSGKTFLGVTIANGVTTGTAVGNWIVENPIPCVYVDGELEHRDMQDRLRNLGIGKRIRKLHLISDAFNVSANLPRINNLLDPNQQAILFKICEKCKDNDFGVLLILDNISVLCPGIDENKKSDWDPINVWLLDLKKSGVNSLYDHHTGKSGDQRGTSAHEDNLDTSIQISLPKDYRTEDGCRFNLHFKKKRVDDQYLHLIRDEEWKLVTKEKPHQWEITTSRKKSSDEIFLMLAQGMGVREIAQALKMKSHSYVSTIKTKLTAHGYFNMKGDLTDKGKQKLNSLTQDDDLEDE